ncbi:MAG: hypothetical protein ABGY41_00185 [Candidatus Poribacteria bacterium]
MAPQVDADMEAPDIGQWVSELPDDATIHIKTNGVILRKVPVTAVRADARGDLEQYVLDTCGAGSYVCGSYFNGGMRGNTRFVVGWLDRSKWGNTREETLKALDAERPATQPASSQLDDIVKIAGMLSPAMEAQRESAQREREFGHSVLLEFIRNRPTPAESSQAFVNQLEIGRQLNELVQPPPPVRRSQRGRRERPLVERLSRSVGRFARGVDPDQAADLVMQGVRVFRAAQTRRAQSRTQADGAEGVPSPGVSAHVRSVTDALLTTPDAQARLDDIAALARDGTADDIVQAVTRWTEHAKGLFGDDESVRNAVRTGPARLFNAITGILDIDGGIQDEVRETLGARRAEQEDDAGAHGGEA